MLLRVSPRPRWVFDRIRAPLPLGIIVNGINWPEVFVGFALGFAPLAARQLYILIKYIRLPGRRKYLGLWWMYHRSTTGSGRVYERHLRVRYSLFLDRLTIRAASSSDDTSGYGPLKYTGRLSSRQGMVRYIFLRDDASHERLAWYIFDPFYDPIEKTVGLYIALDLRGLPAAGPMMMTRTRLSIDEAAPQLTGDVLRLESLLD